MTLYHKQYGEDGPPLIILHGLLGECSNWHTLSKNVFSRYFRVFTVDQRNHGRSPHHEVLNYPSMADDLADFMDQQRLSSAHIMGHSMGGKTAMEFAAAHPERVDRLIVVDMAPRSYPVQHDRYTEAMMKLDLQQFDSRRNIDRALAKDVPSWPIRQFLLKNLDYDSDEGHYRWKANLEVIHRNHEKLVAALDLNGALTTDTLFVRGEKSDYVTSSDLAQIWQYFPNAQLATVRDAAHWVHAEQPDAFARVVLQFLGVGAEGGEISSA